MSEGLVPIPLAKLQDLLSEGSAKSFTEMPLLEIQSLASLSTEATNKQLEIRRILEIIEEGDEKAPRLS